MRFFNTNYLYSAFGGTYVASSNDAISYLCFDEDSTYSWFSDGANSDATQITMTRTLDASAAINRIFIKNTNISDLTIEVDIGAGLVALSSASSFTLTKSADGTSYFYELDATINIDEIVIYGTTTIVANSEKEIEQILAFVEIGQIVACDDVSPTKIRNQVINKLLSGKTDVINKGSYYQFKLKFKNHATTATENALLQTLRDTDDAIWLWLNDNEEARQLFVQEPFQFGDIYKVSRQGNDSASYANNFWGGGFDVDLNYTEVA